MAFISIKALAGWFHSLIFLSLVYFTDFQEIVSEPNYEELKNKGIFMLFSVYFLSTILLHVYKISIMRTDLKIKKETLKAKEEIRKYIENKNKKNL